MKDIMKNLKEMRQQMNFYKGIDQVVKLNEEVKAELMEMKKVEATAKRHADRIDTIFIEFNKKFSDFEKFDNIVKDMRTSVKRIESDFDKIKVQIETKEDKKEFSKLLDKFNEFEKHTTNILNLLDSRSKEAKESMLNDFNKMKTKVAEKFEVDVNAPAAKKDGLMGKIGGIFKKDGTPSPTTAPIEGTKAPEATPQPQAAPQPSS